MNKPIFFSLWMVFFAAPVWADFADDRDDMTASLKALIQPMETKNDACDERVSQAEEALKEIKSEMDQLIAVRDKLWQNIDRLRNALLKQGGNLEIEGEFFCREAVTRAIEGLLEKYESTEATLGQLQGQATAQRARLQESIASQQRWRAKETELLEKISELQEARDVSIDGVSGDVSESAVQEAARLQDDITAMLEGATNSKARQTQVSGKTTSKPQGNRQKDPPPRKATQSRQRLSEIEVDNQNVTTSAPEGQVKDRPAPSGSIARKNVAGSQTPKSALKNVIPHATEPARKPTPSKVAMVRQNAAMPNRQESRPILDEPINQNQSRSTRGKLLEIDIEEVGQALGSEDVFP